MVSYDLRSHSRLQIGINYANTPRALLGCVNDARNVRRFLIKYHHFAESDIVLLTDDSSSARSRPTRENILAAMHWLVRDACPNDSLFFHYSGHGAQVPDKDGDEEDGMDEIIFPLDYKRAGYIVDDDMHAIMVRNLPVGCRLTALFDVRLRSLAQTSILMRSYSRVIPARPLTCRTCITRTDV
jgi:hypothetical protein